MCDFDVVLTRAKLRDKLSLVSLVTAVPIDELAKRDL